MEDGSSPLWGVLIILLFIIMTGMFYGFGAAIQNLNENDLEERGEQGSRKAQKLLRLLKNPTRLIQVITMITTLLGICFGAFGIRGYVRFFGAYIDNKAAMLLTILLSVILLLSLGVLSFKKICSSYPEKTAYAFVDFVSFFLVVLTPLTWITSRISDLVVRLFKVDPEESSSDVTEEEILSMVDEAHEQGVIRESEAEMIQNIIDFGDKAAKDIMIHRTNMEALEGNTTLKEALYVMLEEEYSRYPIYQEDLDDILGIVNFKDVVRLITERPEDENKALREIPGLLRPATFIPGTRSINDIFQAMQHKKIHMAIVVDEYGQTDGLLSMEDILEEIVGEIEDEYDEREILIQPQRDNSVLIEGLTRLEDVEEELGITFSEERFETLNGYLTSVLGHIPTAQDTDVTAGGYQFQILSVSGNVIEKVRAKKLSPYSEDVCQPMES